MSAAYKEPHKAWVNAYVARSKQFAACTFLGRGVFDVRKTKTLLRARKVARDMLAEYKGKNYGRPVLIYALTPDNLSVLVEILEY